MGRNITETEVISTPSAINYVNHLWDLPLTIAKFNRITKGISYDSSYFLKSSNDIDFYRDDYGFFEFSNHTTEQTICDITGSGYFTGLLLPEMSSSGGGKSFAVSITVDGETHTETFTQTINTASWRGYIGSTTDFYINGTLYAHSALLSGGQDGHISISMVSNKRINRSITKSTTYNGTTDLPEKTSIIQPCQYLANGALPRIKFNTDFKLTINCDSTATFSTGTYTNRAVAYYFLGDFT